MTAPKTIRRAGRLGALALLTASVVVLGGCSATLGGGGGGGGGDDKVIKIGYVTPQTGPLASFGEADSFVIDQVTSYYKDNGITLADGEKYDVEIITKDTQSDPKRAGDVAADLILKDGVDVILVSSTPETVNPVSDQCEANQVVCISTVAPWQAWYFGRGATPDDGFEWTYHFFWGIEDVQPVYADIWKVATDPQNVAMLLPNDSDGGAWADPATGFPGFIEAQGLTPNEPGVYPNGSTDFSAQISAFKQANSSVLMGIPIPPDFTTFWKQAVQQGYQPEVTTIAKAILFPSAVEALGELGNNLSTEVWWAPSYPYSSSLTGQSSAEYASEFEKVTGKQWTQPLGFAEALFEVVTAALNESASTEPADIRDAVSTLKVDTIVGPVDFTSGPNANVSKTPLVGGQWRLQDDGGYELVIVSNAENPQVPTAGTPEKIDWSAR
ncbi:amino acid/amide ABC transporter substrate-binding protein (HAAT family) [Homoserinimonas aerilata]|uniref:Amino acid/amide ABC transporter substrate-binding protein (HAAT family) n=1 Tax=Homoserinimonas aerilata TaxID=1162970 RepID=A0A542YAB9_9MICO|nr:ABC transporter substrate-binding protein [Homoserinimonas aerilata]TQL44952.1 amino acid/amide ABC transporter substrate-binding protein (HAAT family) [Homoserinimonas aerilata]